MSLRRLAQTLVVALVPALVTAALAQDQPVDGKPQVQASAAQVQQLQQQLAEMRTELDAMKMAMQARTIRSDQGQRMDQYTRGMMGRCGMGRMGGGMGSTDLAAPSQPQVDALTDFRETHAQQHLSQEEKTEVEMAGERSFDRVCSQCHALPSPELHAANDWPLIVDRMRENMFRMHKPVPDESTTQEIVGFLSANAR